MLWGAGARSLAPGLRRLGLLQRLTLRNAGLGDDGACALASIFPALPSLVGLNLRHNHITLQGAVCIGRTLSLLTGLQELDLGSNR